MKGISPLIAAVILIAVTLAIAGILTNFAIQITQSKGSQAVLQAECLDAFSLDRSSVIVSGNNVMLLIRNTKPNLVLENISATVLFTDNSVGVVGNIISLSSQPFFTPISLNFTKKPSKVTLISISCPQPIAEVQIP